MANVLVKDTFRGNFDLFWKLNSQNDVKRIFLTPFCIALKRIKPYSKYGSYLVKKGKWLLHTKNCANKAGRSFIDLTSTTLIDDPLHCNQLCRLQLPSKIIIVF